jgi:CheY-like chemotaxis protein
LPRARLWRSVARNRPFLAIIEFEFQTAATLRAGPPQNPEPGMPTKTTRKKAPSKKHILLVDDDLALAKTYKELIEAHGYEVSLAANGVLAIKHFLNHDVDAIVCDLKMPELEGDMFYTAIERIQPGLHKRFIFITGAADDPTYRMFISKTRSPVLRKPVPMDQLLAEIKRVAGRAA